MKTNKEKVYDFLKLYASAHEESGVTTQYLAATLDILRTNVSSILNTLVAEGRVIKTNGRPVLYTVADRNNLSEEQCFENITGVRGSLRHPIQLAKAAVVYPGKSLDTLIVGEQGTGKSFLAATMHQYAVASGILPPKAPYVTFDCMDHLNNNAGLMEELFGTDGKSGICSEAKEGVLHVDNAHLLPAGLRNQFCSMLEQYQRMEGEGSTKTIPMVIVACDSSNKDACDDFGRVLPIIIELPALSARPLDERMTLIQNLFNVEAARAKKTLVINAELLRCLLLYDCSYNIKQLKGDIKRGCAMAYLREHDSPDNAVNVYLYDFEPYIRKGFLNYLDHREEIERIIPSNYDYTFSGSTMKMSAVDRAKLESSSLYDVIDRKLNELQERGFSQEDANILLYTEFEEIFRKYLNDISRNVVNKEQLIKLVDKRTIPLVETFLDEAGKKLLIEFPPSVFYGLCLHIDSMVKGRNTRELLTGYRMSEIVEQNKAKYLLSQQFVQQIESTFSVKLPAEEAIFITMFLCFDDSTMVNTKKPVILIALLGNSVAASLAAMITQIIQYNNAFFFEIPLEHQPSEVYTALSDCVKKIDRGRGVVALYDMEFLKTYFESIAIETGVEIRTVEFPITLMAIEWARRATVTNNVDALYQNVMNNMDFYRRPHNHVIVTVCTTGEGSAQELKKYIEKYGNIHDMEVVSLSIADQEQLRDRLQTLQMTSIIHCLIGVNDPKLFGIPFIPISDVLGSDPTALPEILKFKKREKSRIDFDEVFHYLEEQLEFADVKKIQRMLPPLIDQIDREVLHMSLDTEIGLLMHIACCINRILGKDAIPKNLHKDQILKTHADCYKKVLRIVKPLEKSFGIIFPDDEIANIIMIINKL
ncbi:MAG: PRD domain-containing protein [Pelolinea sp.]|jgi:transcriptional regulatory protein LevR/transcriptional regulator with AAA-type ATPase domain|nr:PRD domain-containing protein [Pelolinea sp.]